MKRPSYERFHIWPAPTSHQTASWYIEDKTGNVARYAGTLHNLATASAWWTGLVPLPRPVITPACPICRRQKEDRRSRFMPGFLAASQKR